MARGAFYRLIAFVTAWVLPWVIPFARAGAADVTTDAFVERMTVAEPKTRALAVAQITELVAANAQLPPDFDDALFTAARIARDELSDVALAKTLYQRIVDAYPDGRLAAAATKHLHELSSMLGGEAQFANEANLLAKLIANADLYSLDEVRAQIAPLLNNWPGARRAQLFWAELVARKGQAEEAAQLFEQLNATAPTSQEALVANRRLAAIALDERDWNQALALIARLPQQTEADIALVDEVRSAAQRGQRLQWWYGVAWVALLFACACLAGSLAAIVRKAEPGRRKRLLLPPVEVVISLPVFAILYGGALTTYYAIAPAVLLIGCYGLFAAWCVGAVLCTARHRLAWLALPVVASVGALAVTYVALLRQGLLWDMLQALRFGPEL